MKERESKFELLRVFAMFMIVLYHIFSHSIMTQLGDGYHLAFSKPEFDFRLCFLAIIAPMGKIGDTIFILICGYFMANRGNDINLLKISKKLILQQLFAALVLVLGSTGLFFLLNSRYPNVKFYLANINIFNEMSWFVGYYFVIILIGKFFFNGILSRLSEKQYLGVVVTLFAISQFSWIISTLTVVASGLATLVSGIFLYSLGGLFQKFNPFKKIKTGVFGVIIVISNLLILISNYNAITTGIERYSGIGEFVPPIVQYTDNSLLPIVIGVSLFAFFERLKLPVSKVINYLGASTFMIYLLHDSEVFYSLWNTKDWICLLFEAPFKFMGTHFLWAFVTFLAGVLAYSVFFLLEKLVKLKTKRI